MLEQRRFQRNKQIRATHVPVVLRNLVFEDQMVSICVPGQLGDEPVILVRVAAPVGENHVRIHFFSYVFKKVLHLSPDIREETISEALEGNVVLGIADKKLCCLRGFVPAKSRSAENDPMKFQSRIRLPELQKGAAAADLAA